MDLTDTIINRKSQPLLDLAIDEYSLEQIFRCALTAPDHKRLRPWRFIVCEARDRPQLTELILSSYSWSSAGERHEGEKKIRKKLSRAPHIIICGVEINLQGKVPEVEQILSAGASIQNMINAAEALGYNCYWRTGDWAYNKKLIAKLGFSENVKIAGFLGIGGVTKSDRVNSWSDRPHVSDHFRYLDRAWVRKAS